LETIRDFIVADVETAVADGIRIAEARNMLSVTMSSVCIGLSRSAVNLMGYIYILVQIFAF
jgi:hypothetical protein